MRLSLIKEIKMILNELDLLAWKSTFFRTEHKNLEKYLDQKNKNILNDYINKKTKFCDFDPDTVHDLLSRNPDTEIINAFYYVFSRTLDFKWNGLFKFLEKKFGEKRSFILNKNKGLTYNKIRQCRPDKKEYAYEAIVNIGFYNKNKDFQYKCYNDDMALKYLGEEFGIKLENIYKSIPVSQARSDLFLVASLYKEGGISADVCSIALSNIKNLVGNSCISLVYDEKGLNKKFFYAYPGCALFKSYLSTLIRKIDCINDQFDYNLFSSRNEFHDFVLDFYPNNISFFNEKNISFIKDDIFKAYIIDGLSEENLSEANISNTINFKALSKKSFYENDSVFFEKTIVAKDYFSPRGNNICVIGHDANPNISRQCESSYSISSIDVVRLKNVGLSGHACLWWDEKFINFESYLSSVAENEYQSGHWKKPNQQNITHVIEDDVIVAFSAGYGCYGHYIVDDLPRIGAIKKHIGDEFYSKKFIVPQKIPKWGIDLLKYFFGISENSIVFFNHETDIFHLNSVILSSYPSRDYKFHSFIKDFYDGFPKNMICGQPFKRICLSRKSWEKTKSNQRIFLQQDLFEEMALARGFEIIQPEKLSISEQIDLMANTTCQIGEHGSAQHASVYNPFGMTVGTLNPLTEVQVNLGKVYNDKNFLCYADGVDRDERNNYYYSINAEKLKLFFDEIEQFEERKYNLLMMR